MIYSHREKEMLLITWANKDFHIYLAASNFHLHTDAKLSLVLDFEKSFRTTFSAICQKFIPELCGAVRHCAYDYPKQRLVF